MMLEHFGWNKAAELIVNALDPVLARDVPHMTLLVLCPEVSRLARRHLQKK